MSLKDNQTRSFWETKYKKRFMFLDFKTTTVRSQCCYFTHVEQTALHCKQLLCDEKQHLQPNGKYIKIPEGRTAFKWTVLFQI